MSKSVQRWVTKRPISTNEPGSSRRSTRSRAVSFPPSCCFLMRSGPPPTSARSLSSSRRFMWGRGGRDDAGGGRDGGGGGRLERVLDMAVLYTKANARGPEDRGEAPMTERSAIGLGDRPGLSLG